ncbi:MAG: Plug domain-containing protein, partial [Candidatus Amulumruptor sp.]|nr:Plug domain-containing protein [Candidatus Amulumruptor sp.]
MTSVKFVASIVAAGYLLATVQPVKAEMTVPVDSTVRIAEVEVVAIKQGRNLRLQPEAVTVVGRLETERLGITAMKGVSEVAPNFYIPDYGSRMTSSIYVRGLGARIDQPVVGLNVDNVPFLNKDSYYFDLLD